LQHPGVFVAWGNRDSMRNLQEEDITLVAAFALDPGDEVTISHLTAEFFAVIRGDDGSPKTSVFIVWVW